MRKKKVKKGEIMKRYQDTEEWEGVTGGEMEAVLEGVVFSVGTVKFLNVFLRPHHGK